MHDFGLSENDLAAMTDVLSQFSSVYQALIFGSRAKGNYKPGSDVDLVVKGDSLSFDDITRIGYLLNEETMMPYRFDVLHYETITAPELVDHIDRVGVPIYPVE
jgi:predicted nucleotidyltransferase